jgi:cytochrome bd ubiquinol oxidase subunit II
MINLIESGHWLPLVFAFLMGLSMLIYGLLDGYDLGVGVLSKFVSTRDEKNTMIASIGPFWDANETWLVLGVGILLVAFPKAHGIILSELYIPVFIMLIGLIFRGIAFDFRMKAQDKYKNYWDNAFFYGSLITALAQGYMLGSYIVGFEESWQATIFSILVGFGVAVGYCLIGANWLIMKTEGDLQKKAINWAKFSLYGAVICIFLVSIVTPVTSARIFNKWFAYPLIIYLSLVPLITGLLILWMRHTLQKLPLKDDALCWLPFVLTIAVAILCFGGLAYSFYPFIVPGKMLIIQAAASTSSLLIILVGALIVLPILFAYTFLAYKIFHGKSSLLKYD